MLTVTRTSNQIEARGHAGAAPHGEDLVCAAFTTLCRNLIESIYKLTDDRPPYELEVGYFNLDAKDLSKESRFLIDSFFVGVDFLSEVYPEYVRNDDKLQERCGH